MKLVYMDSARFRLSLLVLMIGHVASAQQMVRDTLPPALKESERMVYKALNSRTIDPVALVGAASPFGVPDPVKYIQALPGVAGGADGSSAYYVRGGNHGNNLQTLDGVPLYGGTHLFGLTSVYSPDIVSSAEFSNGGFTAETGNLSSSHLKIQTKNGSFDRLSASVDASNFLLGGYVSTPLVKNKLALTAAVRVSPLQLEYAALSPLLDENFSFRMGKAAIYDAYMKLTYNAGRKSTVTFSLFNSLDSYQLSQNRISEDCLSWSNLIAQAQINRHIWKKTNLGVSVSYNHFSNSQGMMKHLDETINNLLVRSSIDEATFALQTDSKLSRIVDFQYGLTMRDARFNPGSAQIMKTSGILFKPSSPLVDHISQIFIGTLHGQFTLGDFSSSMLRLSGRMNYSGTDGIEPEFSALARLKLSKWMGVETSADFLSQYYHTLEGIPLGWSADMIVPSGGNLHPEKTRQVYGGIFMDFGPSHVSFGYYAKQLTNLVWYMDAASLFNSASIGWMDGVSIGTGSSKGYELAYEREGKILRTRAAYTRARTDRTFPDINGGLPFHAKFDRRDVLNLSINASVLSGNKTDMGIYAAFSYQSGHWETVPVGKWEDDNFITGKVDIDFYNESINNWQFPDYVRLDVGAVLKIKGGRHLQDLTIGVYNLLNRHNPAMLSYDAKTREWMQVSLIPVMPSIRYVLYL